MSIKSKTKDEVQRSFFFAKRKPVYPLSFLVMMIVFSLLIIPTPLSSVGGYTIIVNDSVDADSNIDAIANKGTDGATSFLNAQTLNDDDQVITEADQGGGGTSFEDYVDLDNSNMDSVSDLGDLADFNNMKDSDDSYANLSESIIGGGDITKIGLDTDGEADDTPLEFSHTLVAGSDRIIIAIAGAESYSAGTPSDITATYGGEAMTEAVTQRTGTSTYYDLTILYILEDDLPSDGIKTVIFTYSGAPNDAHGWVGEYENVEQTTPEATDGTEWASGLSIANTISPSDDAWVISGVGWGAVLSSTHGQSQVEVHDHQDDSSGFAVAELRGANGETSLDSTASGTVNRGVRVAASFIPIAGNGDYQMDQEVQFTDVLDYLSTEKLCIETGSFGASENINVTYWTGSVWSSITSDLTASTWNNYTVSLTSSTFTIKFGGSTTTSDSTFDYWMIDAVLLQLSGEGRNEDTNQVDTSDVDASSDIGTFDDISDTTVNDDTDANLTESQSGSTEYWGDTDSGGTSTTVDHCRAMAGQFTLGDDYILTEISMWIGGSGNIRFGVYQGGTGSDPAGATLLWDADTVAAGATGWQTISGGSASITNNEYLWITWRANDASVNVYYVTSSNASDPYMDGNGRWDLATAGLSTDEDTNYEASLTTTSSTSAYWYNIYITVEQTSDATLDREVQWSPVTFNLPNENLSIYTGSMDAENLEVDVWNTTSSGWDNLLTDLIADSWNNISVSDWLITDTFTIRFTDAGGTDSSADSWFIDYMALTMWNEGGVNYQLEWEHQVQNVDVDKSGWMLCVYGFSSSITESFEIQMWNWIGSSWASPLGTTIGNTEQWYNISISSSYVDTSNEWITYRFRDTINSSDSTQDSLNLDYSGIRAWNMSTYWHSFSLSPTNISPSNSYMAFTDSPFSFQIEAGADYDVQIKGLDITNTPVGSTYIYFNTIDDSGSSSILTTSYQNLLTSQTAGNNTYTVYLWINLGWSAGDSAMADSYNKFNVTVKIVPA